MSLNSQVAPDLWADWKAVEENWVLTFIEFLLCSLCWLKTWSITHTHSVLCLSLRWTQIRDFHSRASTLLLLLFSQQFFFLSFSAVVEMQKAPQIHTAVVVIVTKHHICAVFSFKIRSLYEPFVLLSLWELRDLASAGARRSFRAEGVFLLQAISSAWAVAA